MIEEIQEAIRKNLPEEVGKELQKVLKQAELDSAAINALTELNRNLIKDVSELEHLQRMTDTIKQTESEQRNRNRILDRKEAVMEAREGALQVRNDDIYHLARIAFDNPKLKFDNKVDFIHSPGTQTSGTFETKGGETTERDNAWPTNITARSA